MLRAKGYIGERLTRYAPAGKLLAQPRGDRLAIDPLHLGLILHVSAGLPGQLRTSLHISSSA